MRKPKKPYKSLDEIYLKESFAKSVPPPPRNIIYVYREKAEVVVHKNPPHGSMQEFKVSDEVANQIINSISSQEKRQTEEGELSVNEIIDKVLILDGWKAGNKEYNALLDRVIKIFTSGNFKAENFNNLLKIQKDKNNKFRTALLASPGNVFSFKSLVPEQFIQLFEGDGGYEVADNLWPITFKAKVNVGPGELAITLLSDSVKGKTGDLLFDGLGEIEVKGSKARMGGDGYCHSNTPTELNNIISSEQGKLSEKTLLRIKSDTYKRIENFITSREQITGKVKVPVASQVKYLKDIRDALDNVDSLDELLRAVDQSGLPKNIIKSLKSSVEEYIKYKKGEVKGQYGPALGTFFSMASELSDEQLVKGIVASRNYSVANILNDLTNIVNSLYMKYKGELFSGGTYTRNFEWFMASLHTAIYHYVQKFRGIIYLNDSTRNLLYFEFSNNLQENIESLYSLYKNTNASIILSADATFKSAGVTLNV